MPRNTAQIPFISDTLDAIARRHGPGAEPAPILFTDLAFAVVPAIREKPAWRSARPMHSIAHSCAAWGDERSLRLLDADPEGPGRWAVAVDRTMEATERGDEDGIAWVRSPDRMAIVRIPTAPTRRDDEEIAYILEIDRNGWCYAIQATYLHGHKPPLAELAALAWRGGIVHAATAEATDATLLAWDFVPFPGLGLAIGAEVPAGIPDIAGIAGDRLDLPMLAAAHTHSYAAALLRLVGGREPGHRHRRDFAVTWPGFAHCMFEDGIRARVDAGESSLRVLAAHLGVTQAVARRLAGRKRIPAHGPLFRIETGAGPGHVGVYGLLDAIGHDRLPAVGDGVAWDAFMGCLDGFLRIVKDDPIRRVEVPLEAARQLMLGGGRDWPSREAVIAEAFRLGFSSGVLDMVLGLTNWLRALSGIQEISLGAAFAVMARHGSLPRIIAASARWHLDPRLRSGLSDIPDDATWPVPFGTVDLGEGWSAHALAGPRELRDEGATGPDADGLDGLSHCVGSYARQCWEGSALILSIRQRRDGGIRRITTVELRPNPAGHVTIGSKAYAVRQHHAYGNAPPPAMAVAAFSRLRDMLAEDLVPIAEVTAVARMPRGSVGGLHAQAMAMAPAWRRILPASLSGLDPMEIVVLVAGGPLQPAA